VHLDGFIVRKFITMHGHMNVKFKKENDDDDDDDDDDDNNNNNSLVLQ
jgi:hypothetical protein